MMGLTIMMINIIIAELLHTEKKKFNERSLRCKIDHNVKITITRTILIWKLIAALCPLKIQAKECFLFLHKKEEKKKKERKRERKTDSADSRKLSETSRCFFNQSTIFLNFSFSPSSLYPHRLYVQGTCSVNVRLVFRCALKHVLSNLSCFDQLK